MTNALGYGTGNANDRDTDAVFPVYVWHVHDEELHRDEYGTASFHTHGDLPNHQHQADGTIVYHFTVWPPSRWEG